MILGLNLDPKLLILFVVCVVLLSLIAVEGFADSGRPILARLLGAEGFQQYKSYTDMLRAKYGLSSSASMTASDYAARSVWEQGNISDKSDLYAALKSGEMTWADVQKLAAAASPKLGKTGSYKRDITDYKVDPATSSDWDPVNKRYNYRYETVYTTDKLQYINQPTFEADLRLTQGKVMSQCAEDDFNCMRLMTYGKGANPWSLLSAGGAAAPSDASNLSATQNSAPATMPATDGAGFPTTATTPPTASGSSQTSLGRCILDCVYQYGGSFTEKNIMSCTALCQSKSQ